MDNDGDDDDATFSANYFCHFSSIAKSHSFYGFNLKFVDIRKWTGYCAVDNHKF